MRRVVITGVGTLSPVGIGKQNTWKAVCEGKSGIDYISRFDTTGYPITGIYDIIIDDGAHTKRSIEISFSFLFQYCKIYVIEDLHAARQYYPHEISKLELLKTKWSSPYTNQNELNYIDEYMKVGEIYEPSFYSSTAIIYNKYYV